MKHKVKYLQFYIGNVCNLACPNCASFNNYAFKGQFSWENNYTAAEQWSKILDPYEVAIIGGEPFTNPDLDNWVNGLLSCFQPIDFRITTNGTFLERDIEKILSYTESGVNIEISSHSKEHFKEHNNFIKRYYPQLTVFDDANVYRNSSKGYIEIRDATRFFNISIKEVKDGTVYMHDSNSAKAHESCYVKDCHYIVEGKLYQCVVTGTSHLFSKQFKIDNRSKSIIYQIDSVSPFDSADKIDDFIKKINLPCLQCSLCPENISIDYFELPIKKAKI